MNRRRGGGIAASSPFNTFTSRVPTVLGPKFNDYVASKTSGTGGDYPTGDIWLRAGTYYMDPFDLSTSTYKRSFDNTKPYNNWLRIREFDGPGTVTFDLRPESAASDLGQSQTTAYGDTSHGGGMRASGTGDFRWIFDGGFKFYDGGIHLNTGQDRIIWHGGSRRYAIGEWRRQFDIVAALAPYNLNTVGVSLANSSPYTDIWSDARMKGNTVSHFAFCCGWRLEGAANIKVIRYDVGPIGDDGMFAGSGSNNVDVIGSVFHEVDNAHDSYTAGGVFQGLMVNDQMHNDCWQWTGANDNCRLLDSTMQGHALECFAENGSITNTVIDRVWQGVCGAGGGDIGVSGFSMNSTNKIGSGAPTTRLSGHFYNGFSNGTGTTDGVAQVAVSPVSTFHAVVENFGGHSVDLSVVSVAVPTGVSVFGAGSSNGFINPNTLTAFLGSSDAPHQQFAAAYSANDLMVVLGDYGIDLD